MEGKRFETSRRNEAEDQIIVAKALSEGAKFAYFDDIHVVYRVHDSNSSASAVGQSAAKQKRIMWALVLGFEDLRSQLNLSRRRVARFKPTVEPRVLLATGICDSLAERGPAGGTHRISSGNATLALESKLLEDVPRLARESQLPKSFGKPELGTFGTRSCIVLL